MAPETFTTQQDAISVLAAWSNFAQMQDANLQAWLAAWTFAFEIKRSLPVHSTALQGEIGSQNVTDQSTILANYVVKQGESMHRISMKFYGTPDHADAICQANNLAWHTMLPSVGSILVIPQLSSTAQTT
jgi:hypothetical protein